MKQLVKIVLLLIILGAVIAVLIWPQNTKAIIKKVYYIVMPTSIIPDLKDAPKLSKYLQDRDNVRQDSKKFGITPVKNKSELPIQSLRKISSNKNYIVSSAHSQHYLTPDTAKLLDEIGIRFRDKCKAQGINAKFIVTSLLRTKEDIKALSGNGNTSKNSLHQYGTTFDITYKQYKCRTPEIASQCDEILTEVLMNFEKRKNIGYFVKLINLVTI